MQDFSNSRETSCDIAGLTDGTRNLDDDVSDLHLITLIDHHVCADRQVVLLLDVVVVIHDEYARVLGSVTAFDDDLIPVERVFVSHLFAVVLTLNKSVETHRTVSLDDGDCIIDIPLANQIALLHGLTFVFVEYGSVRNVIL